MQNRPRRLWLGIVLTIATACSDKIYVTVPNAPTPVVTPKPDLVEFRVNGDLPFATVRVNNSLDGLLQVTTVLPYTSTLTVDRDSVFVSIDARGLGAGFLHAAIFVNGTIFREASSAQFNPVVIVEGTYRRTAR